MSESAVDKALPADPVSQERAGEGEFLDGIYRRYWTELTRYVSKTFGAGPPDPEDVAQAAFTKFASLENQKEIRNPRAFLYRTAHNFVISHHRKQGTRFRYMESEKLDNTKKMGDQITPERVLIAKERMKILERALWKMPRKRRRFLLMNRFDGLSYAEISRQAGLSQSVVRKHVEKALADIQKEFRREMRGRTKKGSVFSILED